MTTNKITVLLADDHPLLRKGLKEMIEEDEEFSIVAEAGNGESALAMIEQHQPAIAVLDIDMPKKNGLEVAEIVQKNKLKTKIIFLTMYDKESIFSKAIDLGGMGYVLKDSAASEIVDALKNVYSGKYYITSSLSGLLVNRNSSSNFRAQEQFGLSRLTETERKVLRLVAANNTTQEIADELFISPRTVETHRNNICKKLDIHGANALVKFALENKQLL